MLGIIAGVNCISVMLSILSLFSGLNSQFCVCVCVGGGRLPLDPRPAWELFSEIPHHTFIAITPSPLVRIKISTSYGPSISENWVWTTCINEFTGKPKL